ncbi:L-tyrosine 3-hydroxylase [Streptomyces diacarni]|uniref:L-tyrosine 3-hydroxylase n=1 Tax=Streptomyces diacarni TaxID=2800381 RepID=A0A367F4C5_9ACTN|nr:L-tyrosine 3-hydroxylase [Streptomyces diacarni]RCG24779.1 L-tyrosine 3-hydroxylase [Streptomyces diacarni]
MRLHDPDAVPITLPTAGSWEFGDHVYGLEPLALPTDPPPASEMKATAPHEDASAQLRAWVERWRADPGTAAAMVPADEPEIDRVFWFRWITGHQTTFCLWQLLAAVLEKASSPTDPAEADRLSQQARCMVRCFSLILLYTSAPPRDIYERVIRLPMGRQHANLSGAWAKDYGPVRPLIRGRIRVGEGATAAALADECALNDRVHEGIAAKVMETGVSLLLTTHDRPSVTPLARDTRRWLYDGIFLTTRSPVSYELIVRQLLRRVHAILLDITANGLYPSYAPSAHDEPAELRTPEITELKESFADTFRHLVTLVGAPGAAAAELGGPTPDSGAS